MTVMRFRNIIFDFDGTLTDSRRDIAGAQLWALRELGFHHYQEEDLFRLIGKPLQETFERLLPREHHPKIPDAIALYAEYYPPRSLNTTTLFPGVPETLRSLRERGHRLAVASTKKGAGIQRVTDHFGITSLFDRLQGSDGIAFKPAPDVIHMVLENEGWQSEDTLMVGDTDADILAGKAASVATCAVTYGALSADELSALHPDYVIDSITALPAIAGGS
ncbi:MAG: phosphoglycolate phosphatase [Bacteroidetes bacterium]|nr:phosphoglycolate phosphatase [Bacteroidota bacterium]